MKTYSSLKAFAKNRNTQRSEENYFPFYQGYQEFCKIGGIPCFALVVLYDKDDKICDPQNSSMPVRAEYMFRFDPVTDVQYDKYNKICAQWGNPEWIRLS